MGGERINGSEHHAMQARYSLLSIQGTSNLRAMETAYGQGNLQPPVASPAEKPVPVLRVLNLETADDREQVIEKTQSEVTEQERAVQAALDAAERAREQAA